MEASIYQRESDGRWVAQLELGKDANGKRKRIVKYGKTEKEVKRKIDNIIVDMERGEYIAPIKDSLIDFLKDYHKVCAGYDAWDANATRPIKSTWASTTSALNKMYIDVHLEPYFKNMRLTDIKPMDLDKFYNYKLKTPRIIIIKKKHETTTKETTPLSMNTVKKFHVFLKSAFNYAKDNDMIKKNPCLGVKMSTEEEYQPYIYDEEQFLKLLDHVRYTDDEIYILIAAGCGLRRGEICGLTWSNIDFVRKTITISETIVRFDENIKKDPKTKKSTRKIKAPSYVMDVLFRYKMGLGNVNLNNKIITRWKPQSLSERFNKLLKKFEMPPTRLHDLRHYNAVIMMNYGVPDKVAAERLGHSSVRMLHDVYQHVKPQADNDAAEHLDRMFKQ